MVEVLVLGGGLAGGTAACALASLGHDVHLLEREVGPHHKLCGEFLSPEGAGVLTGLGLPPAALGAQPITQMRLAAGATVAEAALPFTAWGLSRLRLDAALLERAEALGVTVRRGVTVRGLDPDGTAHLAGGGTLRGGTTLLATGKHDLRGWARPAGAPMVGFKQHLRLRPEQAAALASHVELHVLPGGYAGLQLVEDGVANLCLLLREAPAGGFVPPPASLLAARLGGATALWAKPLAIARVPYGHLHEPDDSPIWRLGDQAAVTPSLTGDGMAIALHSGALAARLVDAGATARDYHLALRAEVGGQLRRAAQAQALLRLGRPAVWAARLFPGALRLAAAATRLPSHAFVASGSARAQDNRLS